MAGQQRIYQQKIHATQTLEKVFNAMEMIAASRIGAARTRAVEADPYTHAMTRAVGAVAVHSDIRHPLAQERTDTNRVAVLAICSDRGLAGAYSATILRETARLMSELKVEGKEPVLFTSGKRAAQFFHFRGVPIEKEWMGSSDRPTDKRMYEIADTLLHYFLDPDPATGVGAVEIVFTRYVSMIKQVPEIRRVIPLRVVDVPRDEDEPELGFGEDGTGFPEYEFIPDVETVLNTLLPLYVSNRITTAMVQSAASELAARQQAMHTATDNAQDLITDYTRLANAARQGEITQEISEIVSGADSLSQSR